MAQPSIHREGNGRKLVAAIRAHEAGRNRRIGLETLAQIRACFDLAQKFVDRARPECMERGREAT
jgi:hypothetical protein